MQVKVELNYLRIAPRKTRQIADVIRGKKAQDAASILEFVIRKPAVPILKLLNSAIATAEHEFKLDAANLYVSAIMVDEGPKLKRFRPVSRGSAHALWKRTSHIRIILDEVKPTSKKKIKEAKEKTKEENVLKVEEPVVETEKKEKPKFERTQEHAKQKAPVLNRIFRRKSI